VGVRKWPIISPSQEENPEKGREAAAPSFIISITEIIEGKGRKSQLNEL
jgi:hypothetical protein